MKRKSHYMILIVNLFMALSFGAIAASAMTDQPGAPVQDRVAGDLAYQHVNYLSEMIGTRVAGTSDELAAANYIVQEFQSMGYNVEIQPFTLGPISSNNIIATRPGTTAETVIVGAHYDSVSARVCGTMVSTGAGDNASGVGALLEAAEALSQISYDSSRTVKFIAFGAEEPGLYGSEYYVNQMSPAEAANTVAMVNLDSVGAGDFFYVYAGLNNNPGWARELALNIGGSIGYDLRTSPQSIYYDYGTTGDWSDHVAFRQLGIPIAYFEWMNWDIEPDGGIETAVYGWIMHTCRDNISFISDQKLGQTADVVADLVYEISRDKLDIKANGSDDPVIINQGNNLTVSISVDAGNYAGDNADWLLLLFHYNPGTGTFTPVPLTLFQSPLFDLSPVNLINTTTLPPGIFVFYFGIDMKANGTFDSPSFDSDLVVVVIQ